MGRKKKFIDKKNSATFQLLARDSSDPNYDDAPGGDRVFVRVDNNPYPVNAFFAEDGDKPGNHQYDDDQEEEDPNSIFADAPGDDTDHDGGGGGGGACNNWFPGKSAKFGGGGYGGGESSRAGGLPEHVRREILELGLPDDGYNYLVHLREIRSTGGGVGGGGGASSFYHNPKTRLDQLPRDIKAYDASRVRVAELRNDELMNDDKSIYSVASKTVDARVQKVVDPEVAALLDDSDLSPFDSDVEDLEEDFVVQANRPDPDQEGKDVYAFNKLSLVDKSVELGGEAADVRQETAVDQSGLRESANTRVHAGDDFAVDKPRVRRLLDDQFDLLEHQEYGTDDEDDDCGDCPSEEDDLTADNLQCAVNNHGTEDLELEYKGPAADLTCRTLEYAEKYENEVQDDYEAVVEESSDESDKMDCETVISTYSNIYNHPAKIGAPETTRKKKSHEVLSGSSNAPSPVISLAGKQGFPVDYLPRGRKPNQEKVKDMSSTKIEQQKRKQHGQESKVEKKERKAAVKEEKREARRLKKEMKELYCFEAQRARRVAAVGGPSSIHLV